MRSDQGLSPVQNYRDYFGCLWNSLHHLLSVHKCNYLLDLKSKHNRQSIAHLQPISYLLIHLQCFHFYPHHWSLCACKYLNWSLLSRCAVTENRSHCFQLDRYHFHQMRWFCMLKSCSRCFHSTLHLRAVMVLLWPEHLEQPCLSLDY